MMTDTNEKINHLLEKLELLLKKQDDFAGEISALRSELNKLKNSEQKQDHEKTEVKVDEPAKETGFTLKSETPYSDVKTTQDQTKQNPFSKTVPPADRRSAGKSDLEKFIGENLINKIGIAITVIGVAIGAKYSIENDLISPLTRIILGYLFGLVMMGFGIKLKSKYENYSAVLVSGSMAIMYFITYSAYGLYELIPQLMAFILMLIFTVFTVIAALNFNRQVIALIGLVGAYAVPFLLSDGSGKVAVLFSYMAILNIGILVIAFKKYWKHLYNVSFGLTWIIVLSWYVLNYQTTEHFGLALVFISVFFAIFYITFLAYKLLQQEKFVLDDIVLVMINSFVFYGMGYTILDGHQTGEQLLGLFTLVNGIVHFIASIIIFRQKLSDKSINYLISGLVLIFITLTVPVQLNGNWVTLLWAGESALLFWIGRTKNVSFYEKLSYPLMFLAFFSMIQDWSTVYYSYSPDDPSTRLTMFFNINFLTSLLFISAFVFINILNQNKKYQSNLEIHNGISRLISFSIPGILLVTLYYGFRIEIENYWNQLYADSLLTIKTEVQTYLNTIWNYDLSSFKKIWLLNYSLFFVSILSIVNRKVIKNQQFGLLNLGLIAFTLILFLIQGLYSLSELRESYLEQTLSQYYERSAFNLWIRYLSFSFVALALYSGYKSIKQDFQQENFKMAFELLLHTTILWIASSELINWMDIFKSEQSYKLGLSILWGVYSLFLIAFGIWKKNKPMRIGAIALFGITLFKLFLYDISHLNTIAKTIVFVSLGLLLLIISFLYNKYKHIISDDETPN